MDILSGLNDEQQRAVKHGAGPLLIIAGAGTGKTTVITRRIGYILQNGLARSDEILALTFTDKAAGEMEERVAELLPIGYFDLWISTFHAFGERMVKEYGLDVGLSNNFRLLSESEQWSLMREHLEEFDLDYYHPKGNPTKFIQALISHFSRLKDEDITAQQYVDYAETVMADGDAVHHQTGVNQSIAADEARRIREVARAYHFYERMLADNNAMDFGDLIVQTIRLLRARPAILAQLRARLKYILVDEFQDTNYAQYELVKLLAHPKNNITVVGDDDQSIYAWRGASMSSILNFKKDFPNSREVALTQNYRSPQNILDCAHNFIQKNNPNRLEETLHIQKRLQSQQKQEGMIEHLHAATLSGEAELVLQKITALKEQDPAQSWNEFAILVRANDHAETFLPYLERARIPYQFLASRGLFGKSVILDVMAFLRLCDNYHESRALYRVLHWPVWELPPEDVMALMNARAKSAESLFEICRTVRVVPHCAPQSYETVEKIIALVEKFTNETRQRTVGEVVLQFLDKSGYLQYLTAKKNEEAEEHILYLNQFYKYIEAFERSHLEKNAHDFIAEIDTMMESGEAGRLQPDFEDGPEALKIMTVHAAKGLEFDYIFVVNLVEQRFPSTRRREAIPIPDALINDIVPEGDLHLEEERRIFYVALTRAKRGVFLTSAEDYGGTRKKKPSRFLLEAGFVDWKPHATGAVLFDSANAILTKKNRSRVFVPKKHLPRVFSYTQLKAYDACPWQYRFAYILKVPVPGRPSLSFGRTMHAVLYEFFRALKERTIAQQSSLFGATDHPASCTPSRDDLLVLYEKHWIDEWYPSRRNREEYYHKGREALEAFYDLHQAQWPRAKLLEERFNIPLNDVRLKGAMDRVDETPNGLEIVDYKTGRVPKSGKRDSEQLYLYALALKEVFHETPAQLTYYFIEENKKISEEFLPEKLEKTRAWIMEIITKILEGNFEATPGFHCQFCDYRDICEFRSF